MKKNRNLLKTCAALTAAALFAAGLSACGEDTVSSPSTIGGKEALVLQTDSDLSLFLKDAVDLWNQGGASLSDDFMPSKSKSSRQTARRAPRRCSRRAPN